MTHPLKVVGEVQMKALSHDMTMLRRTNDRLREQNRELLEALEAFALWAHDAEAGTAVGELATQARAAIARATGQ